MVAIGENEVQGTVYLRDHFAQLASRGGVLDEIDPMTTTGNIFNG